MASIDRVMALAEELKKKKKNPEYKVNQSLVNTLDVANDIRSGNQDALKNYITTDNDFAPIKTTVKTNNSNVKDTGISSGYVSSSWEDLRKREKELQEQISNYDRKKNEDYWWDKDKNVVQNILRLPKQLFRSDYAEQRFLPDENYDALWDELDAITKAKNDKYVAEREYGDGISGAAEKVGDTVVGNLMISQKGIESTAKKILGQTPTDEELAPTMYEQLAQKARQETDGAGGVALDVIGSGSRMLPQLMIGNPTGAAIMGFANYGGGAYNQARQEGYSEDQAVLYGSIVGGSEILLGKLLGTFEDASGASGLSNKIMSKVIQNEAIKKYASGMIGEFTEEYLQEFLEPIFRNTILEEENGADFWNTMKDDFGEGVKQLGHQLFNTENLKAGAMGALTSGVMGGPSAIDNYRYVKNTGRSLETGLTANEQSIIDKEVQSRVAELEQDGTKLTKKQITEIEKQVRNDLEKGYISTDTIESTLGGETYNQLKSTRDTKTNLENKIAELESKPNAEITVKEMEQLQSLREQLKSVDTNTLENNLRSEMGQKIKSDAYLQRSYQEKANRSVQFEADVTKYDAKQQAVVQKAIDSGILNNTNRTHDFVDMVAKISADKGIDFDFTNNTKLKESGFAVEGKTVNGYIKDGSIAVNIDSSKALNRVVGHEITHVLEGTELYTELQNAVKQYATTKGEYDTRLADLTKLYKDVKGANVENELTADLVGDYLFTDTDFINNLSTEKPSLFKKVYNEIKQLYNMATAGSKEARELLKVKKAFEKAYKENITSKETTESKFTITEGTELYDRVNEEKVLIHTTNTLSKILNSNSFDGDQLSVGAYDKGNKLVTYGEQIVKFKPEILNYADAIYENDGATRRKGTVSEEARQKIKEINSIEGLLEHHPRFYDEITFKGQIPLDVIEEVGIPKNSSAELIDKLTEMGVKINYTDRISNRPTQEVQQTVSKVDSQGKTLTKEQIEFFKDSKIRDENGNLLVVYHGTKTDFNVFDINKAGDNYEEGWSQSGRGFYFTDNKTEAKEFGDYSHGDADTQLKEVYLNITNPFDTSIEDTSVLNEIGKEYNVDEQFLQRGDYLLRWFRNNGIEGTEVLQEYGYDGIIDYGHYVAFKGNQIKNTDNTKPTLSEDIRYSLSSETDNQGRTLTNAQVEYFKDSKVRDDEGNLLTLYHGTPDGSFTVFDINKFGTRDSGFLGKGFYFTEDFEDAEGYSVDDVEDTSNSEIKEVYLNLKNPYIVPKDTSYSSGMLEKMLGVEGSYSIQQKLKSMGYDGVIYANPAHNEYVAFYPEQIKSVDNLNPTDNPDINLSLSNQNEAIAPSRNDVFGRDIRLEIAPLQEEIKALTETVTELKEQLTTTQAEIEYTQPSRAELDALEDTRLNKSGSEYANEFFELRDKYGQRKLYKAINEYKLNPDIYEAPIKDEFAPLTKEDLPMLEQQNSEAFNTLTDEDYAPVIEDTIPETEGTTTIESPLEAEGRDIDSVGNRKVKAYQYENPEVRPYFQAEARVMLGDLKDSVKGERSFNDQVYYDTAGEQGFYGTKRQTTDDIAYLIDSFGYTYAEIEKGLNAIIEDHGAENIAVAKRIEFMLDERLREGYTSIDGTEIPANQEYINLLHGMAQAKQYREAPLGEAPYLEDIAPMTEEGVRQHTKRIQETFNNEVSNERHSPISDEFIKELTEQGIEWGRRSGKIAPTKQNASNTNIAEDIAPIRKAFNEGVRESAKQIEKELGYLPKDPTKESSYDEVAEVLTEEPKTQNDRNKRKAAIIAANVLDKGLVFENVSLKHKNRELMGKWDYTLTSEARAQTAIGQGHYDNETGKTISKSLNEIMEEVNNTGLTKQFYEYIYHKHNVDRMQLTDKFEGMKNKPVFGEHVTAADSQEIVNQYEFSNPEFMDFARDVYEYVNADRKVLVDNGVISQETADLWSKMYPHYVPIRRAGHTGNAVNVPLDTGRTGINAPIKKATGGSSDILPLFDTMAMRTLQTYRAAAKNSFGVELKNTIGTTINSQATTVDEVIDSVDAQESLLQEGKAGQKPTFTVFENGEKITFEITEDMYDALKPLSDSSILSKTIKPLNIASSIHRGLLTQYNPVFAITNGIKDIQDVLLNSQHVARTYAKIPEAYAQVIKKGYWYQEYMANGGEHNSYFDSQDNTFKTENKGLYKLLDTAPLKQIAQLNDFIESVPRLAEYIASREMGRSIEVSMLDAARVTTNFKAGGNLTKFLNRNGATFLNASVQGAMQQVRNVREAKANGIRGWANLATKFTIAGLPAFLLNALLWDDDEEYEELSDYVKQNYYIVAKTDDGKFIRIPKGRTVAVIQDGIEQMKNLVTGDDEVDLASFIDLMITNLAPSNPIESNIFAPIIQVANNETWYGEDLVPTRLQDLPAAEQYDESTDSFSKWLGGVLDISPYKINYLLDQYSGGLGDLILPTLTPEAESGDDSFLGNMFAPLKSKFTTDATMNNQNVSDFYSLSEELTTNAKKSSATDEDVLKNKYINSVKAEMNELYAEKREIQNSDLPASEKYNQVREVQSKIVDLSKKALNSYEDIDIYSDYATVGDRQYKLNSDGEWEKINDKQLEKQNAVTDMLGISPNEYWRNKEEYDYAYENPSKYAVATAIADYSTYKEYASDLDDLKADKDASGKSINKSRQKKVINYLNNLDIDYGAKLMLYKMEYPSDNDSNYEIVNYLNERDDIDYDEMVTILTALGMTVDSEGNVFWD